MKRRNQPRISGITRVPTHASTFPDLYARVDKDAKHAGVSRSWVIACILSDHYHIQTADYRAGVRGRFKLLKRA